METKVKNISQEELIAFNKDFQEVIDKNGVEIRIVPQFVPNKDGQFNVEATMVVYKKVVDEAVKSPFIEAETNENTDSETDSGSEGSSEESA